jgi:hypothetical protein
LTNHFHEINRFRPLKAGNYSNKCSSQFFKLEFFKKGTLHLTFKSEKLWERFNLAAAKGKMWLPDNYEETAKKKPEPKKADAPTPDASMFGPRVIKVA